MSETLDELIQSLGKCGAYGIQHAAAEKLIAMGEMAYAPVLKAVPRVSDAASHCHVVIAINAAKAIGPLGKLVVSGGEKAKQVFQGFDFLREPSVASIPLFELGSKSEDVAVLSECVRFLEKQLGLASRQGADGLKPYYALTEVLISLMVHPKPGISAGAMDCLRLLKTPSGKLLGNLSLAFRNVGRNPAEYPPYAPFGLCHEYGEELEAVMDDLLHVFEHAISPEARINAAHALRKLGPNVARKALPVLEAGKKNFHWGNSHLKSLAVAISDIKLQVKKDDQSLSGDPYVHDLVKRLKKYDLELPLEQTSRYKARKEIEAIRDPAFVGKVRAFLDQPITEDQFRHACEIMASVVTGSANEEAKALLLELFYQPKLPARRRVDVLNALTDARIPGAARGAIALLKKRGDPSSSAVRYLTKQPDESAADALGELFQARPISRMEWGLMLVDAMIALASPRLLKYVLPILKEKRKGKSDADYDRRVQALLVIDAVGDTTSIPLVLKEMEAEPMTSGTAALAIIAKHPDERAYSTAVKIVDMHLRREFEVKENRPGKWAAFSLAWTLFQKLGHDRSPEVMSLLERVASPPVWSKMHPDEKQFFLKHYSEVVRLSSGTAA